jgi:hypothetical protein
MLKYIKAHVVASVAAFLVVVLSTTALSMLFTFAIGWTENEDLQSWFRTASVFTGVWAMAMIAGAVFLFCGVIIDEDIENKR